MSPIDERRLAGRTAIVTGAGQGIGEGIARALASHGANVVVAARRAATGEPVAEAIRARGDVAICIETDITRRDQVERCVGETVGRLGRLDIMVHNAYQPSPSHRLENVGPDVWESNSRTAVWGSFCSAQAAYPWLRAAGGRGRLILISSPAGVEGSHHLPLYAPVEAAQRALAKSLGRERGADNITVNCLAPVAESPALAAAFDRDPALRARVTGRMPLGRVGDPERDIGSVAVFLASDDASYVTGQTIVCDGGSFTGL